MHIVAIIPARGGSKGIEYKNIQELAKKPLIGWMIEAAKASKYIDKIIVTTDDVNIADISRQFGSEVINRPAEISGDGSSSEDALLHALSCLSDKGYDADIIVFLQCTSPLTITEDIDNTISSLLTKNADSAFSVCDFHYFLWKQNDSGDAIGINHDKRIRVMRQDCEPQYLETGAIYVMRADGFLESKHRFFGKTIMCITPSERCLEIDGLIDFKIADIILTTK